MVSQKKKRIPSKRSKLSLVVVSGLAGAGKTVAIDALEDLGYYCIDNLPAVLLEAFVDSVDRREFSSNRIAVALDSRDQNIPKAFARMYERLATLCDLKVLFLEAQEEVLLTRFRETRRVHPLSLHASDKRKPTTLPRAITQDVQILAPVRACAEKTIDTSEMSASYLRGLVRQMFAGNTSIESEIQINLVSFGFKYGAPRDLDMILDVRCFPNPHYVDDLRPLTGRNRRVRDYVFDDGTAEAFCKKTIGLIKFLFPLYRNEGKSYLAIGFGCTGGKHRSVAIVERVAEDLRTLTERVTVEHRHFDRE
jgi:UPF0042 nucleotide-binding protein